MRPFVADPFASPVRPVLSGSLGAVAAAHPLAVAAGQEMLVAGGTAVDAAIAAQAVLCVVAPDACGLGGDLLMLVRAADGTTVAVNGAGAAPARLANVAIGGGASVTVPGIVGAWVDAAERWGRLPLGATLAPAIRLARGGIRATQRFVASVATHAARLAEGGANRWAVRHATAGEPVVQHDLARLLDRIAKEGAAAFYAGPMASSIAAAAQRTGGALDKADLAAHRTVFADPIRVTWNGLTVMMQPPMTQGVLLAMVLATLGKLGALPADLLDHAGIELTGASFAYRERVAEGAALLSEPLAIDLSRASGRGGPRAYLHTAGVATADRFGTTVSSLVSVFDDFGSGVLVEAGGFLLNNRAAGFTTPPNDAAPGKRPVHTLAPALIETPQGPLAFATPGADGQVQTLMQVLVGTFVEGFDLARAIAKPRWRSEDGHLLVEAGHAATARLRALGHDVRELQAGHMKFGAIVCAGQVGGSPIAVGDWRRETWAGVV